MKKTSKSTILSVSKLSGFLIVAIGIILRQESLINKMQDQGQNQKTDSHNQKINNNNERELLWEYDRAIEAALAKQGIYIVKPDGWK